MKTLIKVVLESEEKIDLQHFIERLSTQFDAREERKYLLRNQILRSFKEYCDEGEKPAYFFHSSALGEMIHATHEMLLDNSNIWIVTRPRIASQQSWWLSVDLSQCEAVSARDLLKLREGVAGGSPEERLLEIDFAPFHRDLPNIDDPRNIGRGLTFLNHYLCDRLETDPGYWVQALFAVLKRQEIDGIQLLIGDRLSNADRLHETVMVALKKINEHPPETPYEKLHPAMQELGFEPGWGDTASRAYETLELLDRLLSDPVPALLEAFVSRIPSCLRVAIVSIHGWIGQEEVLGRPETMGQAIYVLEQARTLERQLQEDVDRSGLKWLGIKPQVTILTRLIPNCEGTACALRLEKLEGTENGWILRVPFREYNPKVTQNWISKYEIWPYLEGFAIDAAPQLIEHLGGKPNLVVGNYSDGNLVAYLLARQFDALQCNIAHSLEKPRYLFSDIHWQNFEESYHFSAQFTADLISTNGADFVIASSNREIVGTPDTIGQYESYKCFTMPHLYRVIDGLEPFSPRFNVVPPGVDNIRYFPYYETEKRDLPESETSSVPLRAVVKDLLFDREDSAIYGHLADPDKRPILAIGSIGETNNQVGLLEWFGRSPAIHARCNLILIANKLHPGDASSSAEANEIEKLHHIMREYNLVDRVRWIGMRLQSNEISEAYRTIADRQGIFINFARFESFGRSVLEAMRSGLPVFATEFGGIAEIVREGENGFYINPTNFTETTEKILEFLDRCDRDNHNWLTISERAIEQIDRHCNWHEHVKQLLLFAKIYGFWDYTARSSREALECYLDTLFNLLYKPKAASILDRHWQQ
jgi:sucrose synthase